MQRSLHHKDTECLHGRHELLSWLRYAHRMLEKNHQFNLELGQLLKTARQKKGLTMQAAADLIGCAKSALGHWETGRNAVSVVDLLKLAALYGVEPDGLIPGKPEPSTEEEKFMRAYAQLDASHKAALQAFLETFSKASMSFTLDDDKNKPSKS